MVDTCHVYYVQVVHMYFNMVTTFLGQKVVAMVTVKARTPYHAIISIFVSALH